MARKHRGIKALACAAVVSLVTALLVVPTTTLAPDVDAFEDARAISLSVGSLDDFSGIIIENCVEPTTEPITLETTETAAAEQSEETTESAAAESTTEADSQTASTVNSSDEDSQTSSSSASSQTAAEPSESEVSALESSNEQSTVYEYESTTGESSTASAEYSGNALISISNPDSSYAPQSVTLSSYDRAKLERLVMGEAGSLGYTGCALVAQAIRDAMNRSNTTSIDRIISEYQYYGSTAVEASQDAKDAVSFIFDQNGMAVQHRIICFYVGTSSWHETQNYITSYGSVRFFDLWY